MGSFRLAIGFDTEKQQEIFEDISFSAEQATDFIAGTLDALNYDQRKRVVNVAFKKKSNQVKKNLLYDLKSRFLILSTEEATQVVHRASIVDGDEVCIVNLEPSCEGLNIETSNNIIALSDAGTMIRA